jgi:KipI family sensor histidine kinase inhibitor
VSGREWRVEPLGEDALLLRFEQRLDPAINRRVHALAAAIESRRPAWLRELVPGFASLALGIDPDALPAADALEHARNWLLQGAFDAPEAAETTLPLFEVPVCYGGEYGPDLDALAVHAGLNAHEAIARHAAGDYRVAMLGFAPGFPYLLGLDRSLAMPRLDTPRTRVAAGSVGIGGAQTGIYPRQGPGGWRIIGRTPLTLFDPARAVPNLLAPGQQVRFVPIDAGEFARLAMPRARRSRT